jgi:predicted dehydrogenase
MFLQMGIHNLDRAVWLAGSSPQWVHAAIRDRCGNWADETGAATLGLEDGALIQFQTDGLATQGRNETILHCQDVTVSVNARRITIHRSPEPEVVEFEEDGFSNELREFAAAVRAGRILSLAGLGGSQGAGACAGVLREQPQASRGPLRCPSMGVIPCLGSRRRAPAWRSSP